MRSVSSIVAGLALTLALSGCGSKGKEDAGSGTTGAGAGPSKAQKQFITVGTAPAGGAFYVVGAAIADVLDANPGGNWAVNAQPTKGSRENIRLLEQRKLNLAMSNAAISYFAVRGESDWKEKHEIRSVMTLAPNIALFITLADSGVKRIADLKGKRVIVGPAGAGFEMFVGPILEAHGVTFDDLTKLNATQADAVAMLGDGSAAAAFLGGAVPTSSIVQAASTQDIFYVPFDEPVRQKLMADYPFFHAAKIPAGVYKGLDQEFEGLNVGSMHLIASAAEDESLVYTLTKAIYENRAKVVEKHPAGKAINPKNAVRNTGTPFHPGAIRYYREIGIWPEAGGSPPNAAAERQPEPEKAD